MEETSRRSILSWHQSCFHCENFRLRCDTIDDSGGSTQRHDDEDKMCKMIWDMRWHLRCGSSVFMRSQNNYEQLRETENKACMCIDLYSWQAHHSVYTKITSTGLFHTGSSKKHFDFLKVKIRDVPPHNRGFAHFFDLFHNLRNWNIHLCDLFHHLCTGIFTICSSSPHFQSIPNFTSWSIVCACFSTRLYSSWIHSMTSLHRFARIELHWTEDNKRRITCLIKQSDLPCLLHLCVQSWQCHCLSDLMLCEVTVNQIHQNFQKTWFVRIVTKREFTWHCQKTLAEN